MVYYLSYLFTSTPEAHSIELVGGYEVIVYF